MDERGSVADVLRRIGITTGQVYKKTSCSITGEARKGE